MLATNPFGYLLSPETQWRYLADKPLDSFVGMMAYPAFMALLPAAAWHFGVTEIGWRVAQGDAVKLTPESAVPIIALFYFAMLGAVIVIGYLTHWMSQTYGAETSVAKGISVIGFACTPLFLVGLVGFYPLLWLDLVAGIVAVCWALYLLYTGVPIVMRQPAEQGFLYASAIVAVAMVMVICIMGGSVMLWDFGAAPVFSD
ncbi:MAG: Yip1 family protein [Pseudomonadales bacterium]